MTREGRATQTPQLIQRDNIDFTVRLAVGTDMELQAAQQNNAHELSHPELTIMIALKNWEEGIERPRRNHRRS